MNNMESLLTLYVVFMPAVHCVSECVCECACVCHEELCVRGIDINKREDATVWERCLLY